MYPRSLFYLFALIIANAANIASAADVRPNIVLIFIDDMGWKDTGYMGSDLYETPNIDRLARQGMVFTNAYASAGNCEPSRACMISGQYTPRHHIYAVGSTNRGPQRQMRVAPIQNVNELPAKIVTFAEALQGAGYVTGMFGKWHLGYSAPHAPTDQGFHVADAFGATSNSKFKQDNDPKHIYRITRGACDFMDKNKDRPFFLYIPHHATHMSIQAREAMIDKFTKKGPGQQHKNTSFAAMNAQVDDGVGIVLDKIKALGIEDNTFVLFTSDNGGLPLSPQTPLRGFKGMYYEGGIREPMIIRWPGKVRPGTTCDTPVINVDFYPTFLELAGATAPKGTPLDGESLVPLLSGGKLKRQAIYWHFPGYLDNANPGSRDATFRTRPVTVMRQGDWKLHLFHEEWALDGGRDKIETNNAAELYNLAEDISESKNLAGENRAQRDAMIDELLAWAKSVDARFAQEPNPKFDPDVKAVPIRKRK